MLSLRRRLLCGTAIGTAVVLSAAGFALYAMMRASLYSSFDSALGQQGHTLAGMIEQDGREIELEFTEADMLEFRRAIRPEYFQVWLADGTEIERSLSLTRGDLPHGDAPDNGAVIRQAVLPDGRPGRVLTLRFAARQEDEHRTPPPPQHLVLSLARDTLDVERALASLRWVLALVGVVTTLICAGLLAWLVRVGLAPVDRLAGAIGKIDEGHLSARLDVANLPRELGPIASRLNELLERLDEAFAREKTMTANVAHEMRTPLAGLRTSLEVTLSRDRGAHDYRKAIEGSLAICLQMQTIVENLLVLARLEAGSNQIARRRTDVKALLWAAWGPCQKPADQKNLHIEWDVGPNLPADTDPEKLRLVLSNLFENAVYYADAGGTVSITAARTHNGLELRVSNTGSRVPLDQVRHVFDRFWRGDKARQQADAHCGLGLALCRTVIQCMNGTITAASSEGGTFAITIVLEAEKGTRPILFGTPGAMVGGSRAASWRGPASP